MTYKSQNNSTNICDIQNTISTCYNLHETTFFCQLSVVGVAGATGAPGLPGPIGATGASGQPGPPGNIFQIFSIFNFLIHELF